MWPIILGHQSQPELDGGLHLAPTRAFATPMLCGAPFARRGDRCRTNLAEIQLCKDADIDIEKDKGSPHRESGRGPGAAQNTASALNGCVLLNCGTGLALKKRS